MTAKRLGNLAKTHALRSQVSDSSALPYFSWGPVGQILTAGAVTVT